MHFGPAVDLGDEKGPPAAAATPLGDGGRDGGAGTRTMLGLGIGLFCESPRYSSSAVFPVAPSLTPVAPGVCGAASACVAGAMMFAFYYNSMNRWLVEDEELTLTDESGRLGIVATIRPRSDDATLEEGRSPVAKPDGVCSPASEAQVEIEVPSASQCLYVSDVSDSVTDGSEVVSTLCGSPPPLCDRDPEARPAAGYGLQRPEVETPARQGLGIASRHPYHTGHRQWHSWEVYPMMESP